MITSKCNLGISGSISLTYSNLTAGSRRRPFPRLPQPHLGGTRARGRHGRRVLRSAPAGASGTEGTTAAQLCPLLPGVAANEGAGPSGLKQDINPLSCAQVPSTGFSGNTEN